MEDWFTQLAGQMPYFAIFGILLLSGFGLPLPEDIPLIVAGYLAGTGVANPWIMFPGCFLAIVGSDVMVFSIGRRYGRYVPRMPLLRRYLTDERLARTERQLHMHGGKFIFLARFLPGLRTPAFFTAGTFKVPYWKFIVFDGSAALLSVPLFLGLAYVFADELERVRQWIADFRLIGAGVVVLGVVLFLVIKKLVRKRLARIG